MAKSMLVESYDVAILGSGSTAFCRHPGGRTWQDPSHDGGTPAGRDRREAGFTKELKELLT